MISQKDNSLADKRDLEGWESRGLRLGSDYLFSRSCMKGQEMMVRTPQVLQAQEPLQEPEQQLQDAQGPIVL